MIQVWIETPPDTPGADRIDAAVRRALQARDLHRAEISVTLLDDAGIQALNREHLGHDRPTDVIAFGLWAPGDPVAVGDVYVGLEQALRQAGSEGVAPDEEVLRLVTHGTLHVAGMDHPEAADERSTSEMYRLQERLVAEVMGVAGG